MISWMARIFNSCEEKGMNQVYVRLIVYGLTTGAAMVPLAWMNWGVTYHSDTTDLVINLNAFGAAIAAAAVANFAVYQKWGVK